MNQYQRVATVLIRSAGVGAFALGVFGLLYGTVLHSRGASLTADQMERWGSSLWYIGFGLVLFLLGCPLGRLVGRDLD